MSGIVMSLMRMEGMRSGGRCLCGDVWVRWIGLHLYERNRPSDVSFSHSGVVVVHGVEPGEDIGISGS